MLTIAETTSYQRLMNYDYSNVIFNLVNALEDWGSALYEHMCNPLYSELMEASSKEPNEDGLIDVDFHDEPITQEELKQYIKTHDEMEQLYMSHEQRMRVYFPDMDMDEFSPQYY